MLPAAASTARLFLWLTCLRVLCSGKLMVLNRTVVLVTLPNVGYSDNVEVRTKLRRKLSRVLPL